MITEVNEIQLKILSLFTRGYNRDYYIREVKNILNISTKTAFLNLRKLEKIGVLKSRTRGKIKLYSINHSFITREYFIMVEQYKKIRFLEKYLLIKEILSKIEDYIEGMTIIFGSYAKGNPKEDSDLDIFIVGKYNYRKIEEIGKIYGVEINIKRYPRKIFKKKILQDILLKEIVKDHIIISNIESFVNELIKY